MKTIVEGKTNIIRLLGRQRLINTKYRIMKYVLHAECAEGVLLLNVITGRVVLLEEEDAPLLRNLPSAYSVKMNDLIENYYLVPEDYDEKNTVQKLRSILGRILEPKGIEGYTILTTTNCNARCFYCYESDLPRLNMDEATAENLVKYMVDHREDNSTLKLHWFGGEPLVCVNRIDQICEDLTARNIGFVSSMTSNGYLFTEQMVKRAVTSWRLKSIQITLDGTEGIYNRTKAYVAVKGSPFQRVLDNIQLLISFGIRVIIRLNLDKHNYFDLKDLINELANKIKDHKMIEVYSHVLFEDAGFTPIKRDDESRVKLYSKQVELNIELEKLGLNRQRRTLPFLKTHHCMADISNSVVVYPDGKLFKCEHVEIGDDFGHIEAGISNQNGIIKFQELTELPECDICPIYPTCILLRNCQGVRDKNAFTCKYDVDAYIKALKVQYTHFIHKTASD